MTKNTRYMIPLLFLLVGMIGITNSVDLCVDNYERVTPFRAGTYNATEDGYEDDDNATMATPIDEWIYYNATCLDEDWWVLTVPANTTIDVYCFFDYTVDDIDIVLYNSALTYVTYSMGASYEHMTYSTVEGGDFYIRVMPYVITNGTYELIYITSVYVAADEDNMEEGELGLDNDNQGNATAIEAGTYEDLVALDEDWYVIELGTGYTIDVTLSWADDGDDYDLYVYSAGGTRLVYGWYGYPEHVTYTNGLNADPANYYIMVDPYSVSDPFYTLTIELIPPIPDDAREDDDSMETATEVIAGTYEGVCYDEDWYSVYLEEGATLTVDLTFNFTTVDLDLIIMDAAGNIVAESYAHGATESLSYTSAEGGTYYIVVDPYSVRGGQDNRYSLKIGGSSEFPSEGGIPGYAPFFMGLAMLGAIGLIIAKRK